MATIARRSRQTMAQEIEEALAEMFVSGAFAPGERLLEEQLCRKFGFTHTPLREAMRALVSRGLVEHLPNRGYRVRVIHEQELIYLYQVREALEGMAARLLAAVVTEEQINHLRQLAQAVLVDGITGKSMHADWEFHRSIAEWSGNPFVSELLLGPQVLARCMLASIGWPLIPASPATDHRLVVEAIATRDPDRAEAAMRAHLQDAQERTRKSVGSPEGPTGGRSGGAK